MENAKKEVVLDTLKSEEMPDSWMDLYLKDNDWFTFPESDLTKEEALITAITGVWLVRFQNRKTGKRRDLEWVFGELERKKKTDKDSFQIWQILIKRLKILAHQIPLTVAKLLETNLDELADLIRDDILGTALQHSLKEDKRKQLAANYTTFTASKVLSCVLPSRAFRKIIDPFCGSGRLVSAYLDTLDNDTGCPELIWINDTHATAVLIAYSRILLFSSRFPQNSTKIVATIGDAFTKLTSDHVNTSFELVLMNPPFTRTHRVKKSQRKALLPLQAKYGHLVKGQPGLHIYAILLADQILSKNATLGAVLSGATFLSTYSQGIQNYLATRYQIDSILASNTKKSFSEDSNLREVILVLQKNRTRRSRKTKFYLVSDSSSESNESFNLIQSVPTSSLISDWNWMRYFQPKSMLQFRGRLLKTEKIKSGANLELRIVRGVEMYGPEFFFLPNKHWNHVVQIEGGIQISSQKDSLTIPQEYIKKSLRRPRKYYGYITPNVKDFALSVPESFNDIDESSTWLKEYIDLTHGYADPAKKKFGSNWIHHIFHQLETKKPWGHLFFVDKFGMTTVSNNVLFLEDSITCTKNFYVLVDESLELARFLAAWLNSSFFFLLFICSRREIGGSFGRLQIVDYLREPIFLDMAQCSSRIIKKVDETFSELRSRRLGSIPSQFSTQERLDLDYAIAEALDFPQEEIPYIVSDLYRLLKISFEGMKSRDKSSSTRRG
ncbi:MAG: N-6 DNA methylase [Candidatus Heimdallarchaeota archaeon]